MPKLRQSSGFLQVFMASIQRAFSLCKSASVVYVHVDIVYVWFLGTLGIVIIIWAPMHISSS